MSMELVKALLKTPVEHDGKGAKLLKQVAEFQWSEAGVRSRVQGETGESKTKFAARDSFTA
jgi:hypothetical protein